MFRLACSMLLIAAMTAQVSGLTLALHQQQHDHTTTQASEHHVTHDHNVPTDEPGPEQPAPDDPECEICHLLMGGLRTLVPEHRHASPAQPSPDAVATEARTLRSAGPRDCGHARAPPLR